MRRAARGYRRDKIVYCDTPQVRCLDLRPDGLGCLQILRVVNFGECHQSADFHVHAGCVEVTLCLSGKIVFELPQKEVHVFPDEVFATQPAQPHHMIAHPKGMRIFGLLFRLPRKDEPVLGLGKDESKWLVDRLAHLPVEKFRASLRLRKALERLVSCYDTLPQGTLKRRMEMKSSALDLLLALCEAAEGKVVPIRNVENGRVQRLVARIRAQPFDDYSQEAMCREVCLSASAFTAAVKHETGRPPRAFIVEQRVLAAEKLLEDPNVTVKEVAERCHFATSQHFTTVFKRLLGHSPRRA